MKTQNQRVNYARSFIISGRPPTRSFDSCFEQGDGDEVYERLKQKALAYNPDDYDKAYDALFDGKPHLIGSEVSREYDKQCNKRKLRENFNSYLTPIS
jgi:hypothetical protein